MDDVHNVHNVHFTRDMREPQASTTIRHNCNFWSTCFALDFATNTNELRCVHLHTRMISDVCVCVLGSAWVTCESGYYDLLHRVMNFH